MEDIAMLGLGVDSGPVRRATDDLSKFLGVSRSTDIGTRAFIATMGLAVAGVSAFGVGITGAIMRIEQMERYCRQLDRALANTGNTARTSASEVQRWADQLELRTGRAAEEVMKVSSNLATFGFGRDTFFRAIELADDMAAAWGGDLRQNLEGLSRALDDPEKGFAMLQKRGVQLSDTQKELVADFLDLNDKAGAQGVVFEALESQVKGVAEAGYGGLTAAIGRARKVWDDAFEELVEGEGKTNDLRDALMGLAEDLSSPEFVSAMMGFGSVIIQVVSGIAQAIAGAWKALQDFMAWLNRQGGPAEAVNQVFGPVSNLDSSRARKDLADYEAMLASGEDLFNRGWVEQRVTDLRAELSRRDRRFDPVGGGVGSFDDLQGQFGTPGSMAGWDGFNPYEGGTFGSDAGNKAAEKAAKAYDALIRGAQQFTAEQQLQAAALGMTAEEASRLAHEQELLNQAANDNIALTPAMRTEIEGLAAEMAWAEEQTRRLTEIYNFGKETFGSFFSDLKSELMSGVSLWDSFANAGANALNRIADKALSMAADGIWDMIFGAVMGGLTGGIGGGAKVGARFIPGIGDLPSFDGGGSTGFGARSGGLDGKGGFAAVLHPNETVIDHTKGAANSNAPIIINNTINVPPGTSADVAPAIAREVTKELRRQLPDAIQSYNRNPLRRAG